MLDITFKNKNNFIVSYRLLKRIKISILLKINNTNVIVLLCFTLENNKICPPDLIRNILSKTHKFHKS